jgi:hypothetical protein
MGSYLPFGYRVTADETSAVTYVPQPPDVFRTR